MLSPENPQPDHQDRLIKLLAQRMGILPAEIQSAAESMDREDILARRRELVERRTAIQAASTQAARDLQERKATAEHRASALRETLAKTRHALEKIAAEVLELEADASLVAIARERDLRFVAADLVATAPPQIGEFIRELQRESDEVMLRGATAYEERHKLTDEIRMTSNGRLVNARLAAIRQAIRDAEALRLVVLNPEEIRGRLQSLRAGLPAVEASYAGGGNWQPLEGWIAPGVPASPVTPRGPRPERGKNPFREAADRAYRALRYRRA